CNSPIEICPSPVGLEDRHSFSRKQPGQAPEGNRVEQRCQVNEPGLDSLFFHSPHERTRFRTDQQPSISSAVEAVKEQVPIALTPSISRRPGELCKDDRSHGFLPRINKLPRKCGIR